MAAGEAPVRPVAFVVMPFGRKTAPDTPEPIDFDALYAKVIRPACEAEGFEVVRSDEELLGGIILGPMFERLLLAEVVVADLTLMRPNVLYELGIRHCGRRRSTLLLFAKGSRLPFDLSVIRAEPYTLVSGVLQADEARRLTGLLRNKLAIARANLHDPDSPIFQLIPSMTPPGLPEGTAMTLRERSARFEAFRTELVLAVKRPASDALPLLQSLEEGLGPIDEANQSLFLPLLIAYRDVRSWHNVIRLVESLPAGPVMASAPVQEQYALALNRRGGLGDRERAKQTIQRVQALHGTSSENCGIMARFFKDDYDDARRKGDVSVADASLNEAISWYRKGFEMDPRDFYTGINLVHLMAIREDGAGTVDFRDVCGAVQIAINRGSPWTTSNAWVVLSLAELAVLKEDWATASRAIARVRVLCPPEMYIETFRANLERIKEATAERGHETNAIDSLISELKKAR